MGAYSNPDAGFPGLGDAMEVAQDVDTGICQEPNGIPFGGGGLRAERPGGPGLGTAH